MHIPVLAPYTLEHYNALKQYFNNMLMNCSLPCYEVFVQENQQKSQYITVLKPLNAISLEQLIHHFNGQIIKIPQQISMLCLNQVLHRTPNPIDIFRPLLPYIESQGYLVIIEFMLSQHNPYPPMTAGVFAYGSKPENICNWLEECYYKTIDIFYAGPLYMLVAQSL